MIGEAPIESYLATTVELQDRLEKLTVEGAQELADWLVKSDLFEPARQSATIDYIIYFPLNRITKIDAITELFSYLIKFNRDVAIMIVYSCIFRSENQVVRALFDKGIIPITLVAKAADELQKPDSLFWFAPELANATGVDLSFNTFIPVEKDVYTADNWKVYKYYLKTGFLPNSIGALIFENNGEAVSKIISEGNYKINDEIVWIYARKFPIMYNPCGLDLAAFFGSKNAYDALLKAGASPTNNTAIMAAAGRNYDIFVDAVRALEDVSGCMLIATKYHSHRAADFLMSERSSAPPPVHFAIDGFNFRALSFALAHGGDAAAADDGGITPLRLAAQSGVLGAVELLVDHGAVPSLAEFSLVTCNSTRAFMIPFFVAHGLDPNLRTPDGSPLVLDALGNDSLEGAVELLKAGADPNAELDNGATLLAIAAQNDSVEAVRALIKAGADVSRPTRGGQLPIHFARTPEVLRALIEAGAAVDAADPQGGTALFFAVVEKRLNCVKFLLKRGAKVKIQVGPGKISPIEAANKVGATDIEKLLKKYK